MNWPIESRAFMMAALSFTVLLAFVPTLVPWPLQWAVLAMGVVALGLPHGALDPATAERAGLVHSTRSLIAFNVSYTAIALGVIAVWWFFPVLSLALFLAISAWHFSGDWRDNMPFWIQWIGGGGLLMLPIVFHTEEVARIFAVLSGPGGNELAWSLSQIGWVVPIALLGSSLYAFVKKDWVNGGEFLSLVALGWAAPPLIFFIVYFCLLHSPRHLRDQFEKAHKADHPRLWKMLFGYTLATLLLAIPLLVLWSGASVAETALRLVFIGLAAVTVPHMLLMVYAEAKTRSTQC